MNANVLEQLNGFVLSLQSFDIKRINVWTGYAKWLSLVLAFVVCVAGAYFQWCEPLLENIKTQQALELEYKNKLTEQFRKIAPLPLLKDQKEKAQTQLDSLRPLLPEKAEIPNLLKSVVQAANQHDLQMIRFQPGMPVPKQSFIEVPMRITVRGQFNDISGFLAEIASQPRIMLFDELILTKQMGSRVQLEGLQIAFQRNGN